MGLRIHFLIWTVSLLLVLLSLHCHGVLVSFQNQLDLYVLPGQSLVLQAQIEPEHGQMVSTVTWEREAVDKRSTEKVRVAEFPGSPVDGRVSVEQQGALLKVKDFRREDGGMYTVTATDQTGRKVSAQRTVKEYEAVQHVSVMVNVSHSLLHCKEAWGTEPRFSWLHERQAVSKAVGHMSADGTTLQLTTNFCGHFTCVVSNQLGHSSATYTAEPCEIEGRGTTVAVICLLVLLLCAGAMAFLLWRRHICYSNRGERLREHYEDDM